jgi:hypothetical protein
MFCKSVNGKSKLMLENAKNEKNEFLLCYGFFSILQCFPSAKVRQC